MDTPNERKEHKFAIDSLRKRALCSRWGFWRGVDKFRWRFMAGTVIRNNFIDLLGCIREWNVCEVWRRCIGGWGCVDRASIWIYLWIL